MRAFRFVNRSNSRPWWQVRRCCMPRTKSSRRTNRDRKNLSGKKSPSRHRNPNGEEPSHPAARQDEMKAPKQEEAKPPKEERQEPKQEQKQEQKKEENRQSREMAPAQQQGHAGPARKSAHIPDGGPGCSLDGNTISHRGVQSWWKARRASSTEATRLCWSMRGRLSGPIMMIAMSITSTVSISCLTCGIRQCALHSWLLSSTGTILIFAAAAPLSNFPRICSRNRATSIFARWREHEWESAALLNFPHESPDSFQPLWT